jgi:carboxyvinyl-carboxyphosphonate phosphorylmutase
MSSARERFRGLLVRPTCTVAANIFDPLSARIAHLLDYEVCFLSGSVGKAANLGIPDMVLSNMSDLVDHCRRITRIADVSLMVDGEDGFGNAVNVVRTVRELEAAGVAAIEIEDNIAPVQFNGADRGLVLQAEQVGKLEAAVAARTDPTTVIVARPLPWPIVRWMKPWTGCGHMPRRGRRSSGWWGCVPARSWRRCTRPSRSP